MASESKVVDGVDIAAVDGGEEVAEGDCTASEGQAPSAPPTLPSATATPDDSPAATVPVGAIAGLPPLLSLVDNELHMECNSGTLERVRELVESRDKSATKADEDGRTPYEKDDEDGEEEEDEGDGG